MNYADLSLAKTEIIKELGYFPAFLIPALDSSAIYQSLVRQTLFSYLNNPLPAQLKEKIFVVLSRYAGINYFTICHSCTLRSQGVSAAEILALGNIDFPQTEADLAEDLQILSDLGAKIRYWQNNPQLEVSLLRCSYFIFTRPAVDLSTLKRLLGINYHYLIVFLGYIKLSHQWVIDRPAISHQQDRRSQLHLGSLLLEEIRLAQFFQSKVKLETSWSKPNTESLNTDINYSQLKQKVFATCLANAPFPVMIHTQQGQILYLNRSWLETTGYSMSEIFTVERWEQKVRVKHREIVKLPTTQESPDGYAASIHRTAAETTVALQQIINSLIEVAPGIAEVEAEKKIADAIRSEVAVLTSNNQQLVWELYSAPLSVANSQDELTISIARDVTEIVRQQNKLAEVEAKLKSVFKATKTIDQRFYFSHDNFGGMGLSNSNDYKRFLQTVCPSQREAVDLEISKAIATHQDLDVTYCIVEGDRETWIRMRGKPDYNAQGQAVGLSGIVSKITPQKADSRSVEQGLLSSNDFKTVLDLLPYYLLVVDLPTQTISLINYKLARSLGLSDPKAAQGMAIARCFAPEYVAQILQQHQQVVAQKQAIQVLEEVSLPDGIHHLNTIIAPICNERGEIDALLHTSSDIHDLAATQKALSQRTLQLEAANKELESFSYSVSHDLQAPLRVINGFTQVLWDNYQSELDERGRHYLQRIQVNSKRMTNLIDALLQLSKVTRSQMKTVEVNLSAIAMDVMEELQTRDPQRQVELAIAPDLRAKGDPQLLGIVLNNLLDNAWKYTSRRSRSIIEFDVLDRGEQRSTYYLKDNGAGFDPSYADKLFTPFQRLHRQTEFPGTGIGLATVKRIIYRHGGRVWAKSEGDRGTTIYFSLDNP